MNTLSTTSTSTFRPKSPQSKKKNSSYLSVAESKSLMASSLHYRTARLEADDMLSTEAAAELVGTSRVTINAWIAKGKAIGLTQTRRGYRLPRWQFEPSVWEAVPQVSEALKTNEGWALLKFFETPNGALDGLSPRQAVEQGRLDQVIELASVEDH